MNNVLKRNGAFGNVRRTLSVVVMVIANGIFTSGAFARTATEIEDDIRSTLIQCFANAAVSEAQGFVLPQILGGTASLVLDVGCALNASRLADKLDALRKELEAANGGDAGSGIVTENPLDSDVEQIVRRLRHAEAMDRMVASTFVQLGGGINFPKGRRDLSDFNQYIGGDLGFYKYAEIGHTFYDLSRGLDVSIGVVAQYQSWNVRTLGNLPPFASTLPLGGDSHAFSLFPRLTISGPVAGEVKWNLGAGAGISYQGLKATSRGVTVLSGEALTPMAQISAGLWVPVNGFNVGLEAYGTWLGGYNVRTNTNVTSQFDAHFNAGVSVSLRRALLSSSAGTGVTTLNIQEN